MSKTIYEAVAEKVVGSSGLVKDTVVNKIAQIEIDKRVNLISDAVKLVESLQRDLKKIDRNDVITYSNGQKSENMSKDRFDQIEKLKQTVGELEKAITTALEENTHESYNKLSDKLKKDGGNKKESGTSSEE